MEVLIGRDTATGRLKITTEGKTELWGKADVPLTVLPEHCQLTINSNTLRIKNLDINAYTYINSQAVESKTISISDSVTLGSNRYPLDWKALSPFLPADIRPLQQVWEEYENENVALQIAERKFNTLRSATGIITMAAIALSIATGGRSPWYIALYALAIIISLIFFVKAYLDSSKMPQRRQQLSRKFQKDYSCPHCGHFLGNQSYDILLQNDHCPYCQTKFIH